jgi:SAM-dependent methyltransferase
METADPDIVRLLASYPRARPPLPEPFRVIHEREYQLSRQGTTVATRLSQLTEAWMHRRAAAAPASDLHEILELGAGSLNHVPYERVAAYDVVEPFAAAYAGSPNIAGVRRIYSSLDEVPEAMSYDRVVSVAVLEHLTGLPHIVARIGLLLREGGHFRSGIPSEGGLLWHAAINTTTGPAFYLRNRLPYRVLMRHEHVNKAREIIAVIRWFFDQVQVERFPTPFHHLSFYAAIDAAMARRQRCADFLAVR